ncbi:MAG TPA: ABC transporter [Gammaproteobacteria bacterium]|nr:ABC transporter [Gammaproteobacteria bacterium]
MKLSQLFVLVDLQARAALKTEASRMYLSYLWWILEPLLFVAVFYVVFSFLLDRGTEKFVFFLMCGKIPYLWLSKSITVASNSLLLNKGLIASIEIPNVVFPYIAIQEVLYKQWVTFLILFVIAIYFDSQPDIRWLWLIPITITTYLMLVAFSLIGSILVTYVQDFRILINMGMLFLMFASGIFWDINDIQSEYWRDAILIFNPLAFLINAYRSVLMFNQPFDVLHLTLLATFFIALTLVMHLLFRSLNSKLTQQVLQS